MEIIDYILIICALWIIKSLGDIRINTFYTEISNKEILLKLESIREDIGIISNRIDNIEMTNARIEYNTDKIRFWTGHRTEFEQFEDEHDIDVGNRKEFS